MYCRAAVNRGGRVEPCDERDGTQELWSTVRGAYMWLCPMHASDTFYGASTGAPHTPEWVRRARLGTLPPKVFGI